MRGGVVFAAACSKHRAMSVSTALRLALTTALLALAAAMVEPSLSLEVAARSRALSRPRSVLLPTLLLTLPLSPAAPVGIRLAARPLPQHHAP